MSEYEEDSNWIKIKLKNKNLIFKKLSFVFLNSCLFVSLLVGGYSYLNEYLYEFSGAKDAGLFIKKNNLEDYEIIAHKSAYCSSILPYFPKKEFWYADIQQFGTFIKWDETYNKNHNISSKEVIKRAQNNFGNLEDLGYFLEFSNEYWDRII